MSACRSIWKQPTKTPVVCFALPDQGAMTAKGDGTLSRPSYRATVQRGTAGAPGRPGPPASAARRSPLATALAATRPPPAANSGVNAVFPRPRRAVGKRNGHRYPRSASSATTVGPAAVTLKAANRHCLDHDVPTLP
jgi:hypothetical protein